MVSVKNISDQPQHFTDIGTFEPDEVKNVSDEQAEILLRSPFIQRAEGGKNEKFKGTQRDRSMKGVERE